ncbi:MAG: hypothetical protein ABSB40_01840 [Nitrososphaeria archaeon]
MKSCNLGVVHPIFAINAFSSNTRIKDKLEFIIFVSEHSEANLKSSSAVVALCKGKEKSI